MNPAFVKALPWLIAAALAMMLAGMTNLYLSKRDELTQLKSSVETIGKQAEIAVAKAKQDGKDNLKKAQEDYENQLPDVRSRAVSNYRMRNPNAGCSGVPANPASLKMDDGAGRECAPPDAFIQSCAADASKVETWRRWCLLNRCPTLE